jgi:hypothetical protein
VLEIGLKAFTTRKVVAEVAPAYAFARYVAAMPGHTLRFGPARPLAARLRRLDRQREKMTSRLRLPQLARIGHF